MKSRRGVRCQRRAIIILAAFAGRAACYGQKNSCNSKGQMERPAPAGGELFRLFAPAVEFSAARQN